MADDVQQPGIGEHLFGGGQHGAGLLPTLRAAGLVIGPREHVVTTALVAELISRRESQSPLRLADLREQLAPILARTPGERQDFFRIFDSIAMQTKGRTAPSDLDAPRVSKTIMASLARALRRWTFPVLIILGLLSASYGAFQMVSWLAKEETPVATDTGPRGRPGAPQTGISISPTHTGALQSVLDAAEVHAYAPTLAELSIALVSSGRARLSAEQYVERFHDLTGLPRRQPINLDPRTVNTGSPETEVQKATLVSVVLALQQIEGLPNPAPPSSIRAAAGQIKPSRQTAWDIAEILQESLPQIGKLSYDRGQAIGNVRDIVARYSAATGKTNPTALSDDLIERAMAISAMPLLHRTWDNAPWMLTATAPRALRGAWWPWLVAGGLPLVIGIGWVINASIFRKAYLRRRRPEFSLVHMDLVAETKIARGLSGERLSRTGRDLRRRTQTSTDRLDVERTIEATLGGGGKVAQPVFATARAAPEYLILIERQSSGDQQHERLRSMVMQLSEYVPLTIYAYQTEPAMLEPDRGGPLEPLDRVSAKYPEHRLIILGSGEGFLHFATRRPVPAAEKLMRWTRRALLTPVPISEWGQDEFALAESLDMAVGRATPEGFLALSSMLGLDEVKLSDTAKPIGDGRAQPLPHIFRSRGNDFLYDQPPEGQPVDQMVADLRNYLDPVAFDWLCALAVYPSIQWDLTLYLGLKLPAFPGLQTEQGAEPMYNEDRIASLAQLPWLREGQMPNWVRRALIRTIPKIREKEIRTTIHRLLESAAPKEQEISDDQLKLEIARELSERGPARGQLPAHEIFDDQVVLDFLAKGAIEDVRYDRPEARKARRRTMQLSRLQWSILGLVTLYSMTAFFVAPKPWDGPLITGAWLPVILLALCALAAIWFALPAPGYRVARITIERIAPLALLLVLSLGALVLLPHLLNWLRGIGAPGWLCRLDVWLLAVTAAALPLSRMLARGAGIFVASAERPLHRWVRSLVDTVIVFAVAVLIWVAFSSGCAGCAGANLIATEKPVIPFQDLPGSTPDATYFVVLVLALAVFGVGVLAARFASERLPPPPARETGRAWVTGMTIGATVLMTMPAVILSLWFSQSHYALPSRGISGEGVGEEVLATSPDGSLFAAGSSLGVLQVFVAGQASRPVVEKRLSGGPIVSLALGSSNGSPRVAAATLDGSIQIFGPDGFAEETGIKSRGMRPLMALDDNGAWLIVRQSDDGEWVIATKSGSRVLTSSLSAAGIAGIAGMGQGRWILLSSDGKPVFVENDGPITAAAGPELTGQVRSLEVHDGVLRALTDLGEVFEADAEWPALTNLRVRAPDPALAATAPSRQ